MYIWHDDLVGVPVQGNTENDCVFVLEPSRILSTHYEMQLCVSHAALICCGSVSTSLYLHHEFSTFTQTHNPLASVSCTATVGMDLFAFVEYVQFLISFLPEEVMLGRCADKYSSCSKAWSHVVCTPGLPGTHFISKTALEFMTISSRLPCAEIIGVVIHSWTQLKKRSFDLLFFKKRECLFKKFFEKISRDLIISSQIL